MNRRHNSRRTKFSRTTNSATPAEILEARQLLAANLLSNGTWQITGTSGDDEIFVASDEYDPGYLLVEINGLVVAEEPVGRVRSLQISGGRGHDRIEIDETAGVISLPTVIRGDDGNDVLIGGSGSDSLHGGNGNDRLFGRAGNDQLFGDAGDDFLDGGPGTDRLDGGTGRNQLIDEPIAAIVKNRVPAEWERHDSTWMQWPKGEERSSRDNFAGIIGALQRFEQVNLVVDSQAAQTEASAFLRSKGVPLGNVQFHIMPYDWSWMRDNGAIWVEQTATNGTTRLAVQDWGFDGWGGDGGPSRRDDAVPRQVARIEGVTVESVPVVLEKGTLEFNGRDTLITSWTVLHDRNPQMTRGQLEVVLKDKFGVSKVVWLEGASTGDITDGHVDGIARFINADTVVVGRYRDARDPDAALYDRAAATIQAAGLKVVRMDIPGYVTWRGESLPANYLNYLVANGVVIGSSYGNPAFDSAARRQLQELFPGREVILTDTRELWFNGGAVHCVTNDQPLSANTATGFTRSVVALNAPTAMPANRELDDLFSQGWF